MIRTIEPPEKKIRKYVVKCFNCKAKLGFDETDIRKWDNRASFEWFIPCPHCNRKIVLQSEDSYGNYTENGSWEEIKEER